MVKAAVVGGTQFDYWATFEHFARVLEMFARASSTQEVATEPLVPIVLTSGNAR